MNKKTSKVRFLALSAVIAALYAVLTYAAAASPPQQQMPP